MRRLAWPLLVLLCVSLLLAACRKDPDPETAAEMKAKLASKVKLVLWKVEATDAQKAQMDKLLDALAPDLLAMQKEDKAIKRELFLVLHADSIDQAALLTLQKRGVELFDRFTKRMSEAALATAAILTLSQRRELLALWKEWELGT